MQYLEFTQSRCFETIVRCHIHAIQFLNGVSREIWFDNLATTVAEHDGRLVRFHPRFLAFAREFNSYPLACNPAAGREKGEVERAGIGYVRQNFWPLGEYSDLANVSRQARECGDQVAKSAAAS
jgi:transposase